MIPPFPLTPELERLAARMVWYKSAFDALQYPLHFIAHVLTYGTPEDICILQKYLTEEQFIYAVEQTPAGIMDKRSWAYWNLKIGRYPPPPLPTRKF